MISSSTSKNLGVDLHGTNDFVFFRQAYDRPTAGLFNGIFFAEFSMLLIPVFSGLFVFSQMNGGEEETRRLHTALKVTCLCVPSSFM